MDARDKTVATKRSVGLDKLDPLGTRLDVTGNIVFDIVAQGVHFFENGQYRPTRSQRVAVAEQLKEAIRQAAMSTTGILGRIQRRQEGPEKQDTIHQRRVIDVDGGLVIQAVPQVGIAANPLLHERSCLAGVIAPQPCVA